MAKPKDTTSKNATTKNTTSINNTKDTTSKDSTSKDSTSKDTTSNNAKDETNTTPGTTTRKIPSFSSVIKYENDDRERRDGPGGN